MLLSDGTQDKGKGNNYMNKNLTIHRITAALMIGVMLVPLASCSLFARKEVIEAADKLGSEITDGSADDILAMSGKKHTKFKEELNALITGEGYTEEENLYADAVRQTMEYEVDESSVSVDGDKATCDIVISLADYASLTGGDYDTIDDLTEAISSCDKTDITFTAEFEKKDDEWRVENLNSEEFLKIFGYRDAEFTIGRASLIETANTLAGFIEEGTSSDIAAMSYEEMETASLEYLLAEGMTGDEKDFADAVRQTFNVTVLEDTATVTGLDGTCDIVVESADYESIASGNYSSISELLAAVATGDTISYTYTAEFTRTGDTWYITNLDSEDFEDIFIYRYLVLSISDFSGTYVAAVDVTDEFNTQIEANVGAGTTNGMTGSIIAEVNMELNKDGTYSIGIDRDVFAQTLYDYADTNIDKLITNFLGVSSTDQIELLVMLAGYKDYADMRSQLLGQVTDMLSGLNTSGLDRDGDYIVSGSTITFCGDDNTKTTDDITGTIDTYGKITVTAPITDPDAAMLFGSDEITLVFAPEN